MRMTGIATAALAALMMSPAMAQVPPEPVPVEEHAKLLESDDPQLAANKKLAYDMYRVLLQAGQWQRAEEFIAEDYIQHNPNVVSGRKALEEFIQSSRPAVPVKDTLELPLISMVAERDRVVFVFVRPRTDENGDTYLTTWYDMFRIEDGKIAEHWDPARKTADAHKFNPNTNTLHE